MEKNILFPTDFSERADRALSEAIPIAKLMSAKLVIYHVYHRPMPDHGQYDLKQLLRMEEEKIEKRFESFYSDHPELKRIQHEFVKDLGVFVHKIPELTEKREFDLIVMATKGAKDFGELLGSKTARTLKSVKVPVLVFPDGTSLGQCKKLALACDYSKESDVGALSFLATFVEKLSLGVDVVSLNRDERTLTDREKEIREEIKEKLQSLPYSLNYTSNDSVEYGILDYAKKDDIGLIATIPKSYNFIERLFHESLTTKLAFHSPIPLLVL